MKTLEIITILAAAASSAATPILHPRDIINPPTPPHTKKLLHEVGSFKVTNFVASAVVLSHRVFYGFDLIVHPNASTLRCAYLGTTVSESLASTRETWCVNKTGDDSDSDFVEEEEEELQARSPHVHVHGMPRKRGEFNPDAQRNTTDGLVSFQWRIVNSNDEPTSPNDAAELIIVRRVWESRTGRNITDEGVYHVPQKDIPVVGEHPFDHQVYTGPKNFTVDAYRFLTT